MRNGASLGAFPLLYKYTDQRPYRFQKSFLYNSVTPQREVHLSNAVYSPFRASMPTQLLCTVGLLRSERKPWALTTLMSPNGSKVRRSRWHSR